MEGIHMLKLEKLKEVKGYLEGDLTAVDDETAKIPEKYKKNTIKKFISLNQDQIDTKLAGSNFSVTRKIDGEFAILFWDGENAFIINIGGKVRTNLPCTEAAEEIFKSSGIKEAIIPSELHTEENEERKRVFDVLSTIANPSLHDNLKLAPFDILSLNNDEFISDSYEKTHEKLLELFNDNNYVKPVKYQLVNSKAKVKEIFDLWVIKNEAEGLVVRSELPFIYKIKPQYNIDVVVVGFSERISEGKGQIRSLLLALMPEKDHYQIIGRVGGGFSEETRRELFNKFMPMTIESNYIETDSNHTAFHMIKPDIVIEININDILFENVSGPILNPLLVLKDNVYSRIASINGIGIIFPSFERIREDKNVDLNDVRLEQIHEFVQSPIVQEEIPKTINKSKLLKRVVYKKESPKKLMVHKFLVWKTNKEDQGFPSFVLSHTNFSSNRKEPLKNQARISSSENQIMEILQDFIKKNVKKGWIEVINE
jgi:ATP-dependent DNA ligase